MSNTIDNAIIEAKEIEAQVSKLITEYQNKFKITVTEIKINPTFSQSKTPIRSDVEFSVKLK